MTVGQTLRHLQKQPHDALYYVQGVVRHWLYRRARWLLRWHIIAQFERRKQQAETCYLNASCICCGCETPSLFFADKACSAGKSQYPHCAGLPACYPRMKSAQEWYWSTVYR